MMDFYERNLVALNVFCTVACLVILVVYNMAQGQNVGGNLSRSVYDVPNASATLVAKSEKSAVYRNSDGTMLGRFSTTPIYYNNGGTFEDIDTTVLATSSGFYVEATDVKLYAKTDFSSPDLIHVVNKYKGQDIELTLTPSELAWVRNADFEGRTTIATAQSVSGVASSSVIQYTNAFGDGIDYEIVATPQGIRKELVIQDRAALGTMPKQPGYNLVVVFTFTSNADIKNEKGGVGKWDGVTWTEANEFYLEELDGDAFYLPKPILTDGLGEIHPVRMIWANANGTQYQIKAISSDLINSVTFPIRTDTVIDTYDDVNSKQVVNDNVSGTYNAAVTAATGNNIYALGSPGFQNIVHDSLITNWYIRRADLQFDTSIIPSGASVTAADLKIHSSTAGANTNGYTMYILNNTDNASLSDPVVAEDYNDFETDAANAIGSITFAALDAVSSVKTVTLSSTAVIEPAGTTRIGVRSGNDMLEQLDGSASDPTGQNLWRSGLGSTGDDPYLDVTWTEGGGATGEELFLLFN